MPAVRLLDNVQLEFERLRDQDQGGRRRAGKVWPGQFMVMDPAGGSSCRACTPSSRPSGCRPPGSTPTSRKRPPSRDIGGRCRDRAGHPSHRNSQGQRADLLILRGGRQVAQGTAQGAGRAHQGHRAEPDHPHRHRAGAGDAARRADFDPRSRHHPGRHRRRPELHPQLRRADGARAGAARPPYSAPSIRRPPDTCR